MQAELYRFELQFKEPAMTSRGTYVTHTVWYPVFKWQDQLALGECAPLPDLSADFLAGGSNEAERTQAYETKLTQYLEQLWQSVQSNVTPDFAALRPYSSILFGLECLHHLYGQRKSSELCSELSSVPRAELNAEPRNAALLWPSSFSAGTQDLPINGLIWMGSFEQMARRIEAKLAEGYRCIKLKIGALDFAREMELLTQLRQRFSPEELELRVDANGAFTPDMVEEKLKALAALTLHSIEQPIKAGQWELMAQLCAHSPIAIGLDEELIGVTERASKERLLDTIKPRYLILKPSLHGGISGCTEWMSLARARGIGYWVTSALESNIGLNAIAQWCGTQGVTMPQGLGTGLLYTNNVASPLSIVQAQLHCDLARVGDYDSYLRDFLEQHCTLVARFGA